jgi:hypothetical protein
MARRILNRKDLRADYDAAERRKQEDEEQDETEDEDQDEGDEEEAVETDEAEAEAGDQDEEEAPKKSKPVKAAKPRSRSRAAKVVRLKVVWGVFNNTNQRVAVFDYPRRQEAEELAAKLKTDKKSTHFVQPVKEPIEEKNGE